MKNVISFKVESVYFNSVLPFKIKLSSLLSKVLAAMLKNSKTFMNLHILISHILSYLSVFYEYFCVKLSTSFSLNLFAYNHKI